MTKIDLNLNVVMSKELEKSVAEDLKEKVDKDIASLIEEKEEDAAKTNNQ